MSKKTTIHALISFSAMAEKLKNPVKVIHISDESIARGNKNIEPAIKENRKERQLSLKRNDGIRR